MINKAKEKFNQAKSNVGNFVKEGLSSHKAMENTSLATKVISNPVQVFTLSSLLSVIHSTLQPPDKTEPAKLSSEVLHKVNLCVLLSDAAYQDLDERVLPPEAGQYIYDSPAESVGKISYFITKNNEKKIIYVVCRGSFCFNDFATDAMANAVRIDDYFIHDGFFKASQSIYVNIQDLLIQQVDGFQIVFTGHSLGAAVAGLVADMFAENFPDLDSSISSVLFAPPASISKDRWAKTQSRHLSFILGGDCVPFLTLHNIASLSSEIIPDYFKSIIDNAISRECGNVIDVQPYEPNFNPFEAPPPQIDQQNLETLSSSTVRTTTALYPEGDYYHLELVGESIFRRVQLMKIKNPDYFGRFVLGLTEEHHFISLYKEAIAQLYQQSTTESSSQ